MLTVNEIRILLGAPSVQGMDITVRQYSIDTRTLESGDLFFALSGDHVDGAQFVGEACEKGVCLSVVDNMHAAQFQGNASVVCVPSVLSALHQIARESRRRSCKKVIAITGSTGKTTVKELLFQFLSTTYAVTANKGNLNNHIGAPLSFLNCAHEGNIHIAEIGASHPGDIRELAGVLEPDIGVITNVSPAHLSGFGTLDSVYGTKTELWQYIAQTGSAMIIDGDDARLSDFAPHGTATVTSVGLSENAQYVATSVSEDGEISSFQYMGEHWSCDLTKVLHVKNVLIALAVAHTCAVPFSKCHHVLKTFSSVGGRYTKQIVKGMTIVDDCYNANPASFVNALRLFSKIQVSGRKVLVCSDMLELGDNSEILHKDVGKCAAQHGIQMIVGVGDGGAQIIDGFNHAEIGVGCYPVCSNEEAISVLKRELRDDDAILFKASRGRHLEEIIQKL